MNELESLEIHEQRLIKLPFCNLVVTRVPGGFLYAYQQHSGTVVGSHFVPYEPTLSYPVQYPEEWTNKKEIIVW